jgi:hypothetical protein
MHGNMPTATAQIKHLRPGWLVGPACPVCPACVASPACLAWLVWLVWLVWLEGSLQDGG